MVKISVDKEGWSQVVSSYSTGVNGIDKLSSISLSSSEPKPFKEFENYIKSFNKSLGNFKTYVHNQTINLQTVAGNKVETDKQGYDDLKVG
ncbi:MAG: hypothetical protein Q3978_04950 [Limosilactobacillus gorillae]|uniref:hypothetical protein n=1 Tax=Limosilactobacillus gorillae TaxID=1450649 RepID=UPI000AAC6662|nr:hypothetical protein [Limosilactobacillus gorillae]MDO4855898.1 hypothetical protein [Limosilactobacillus gorillae]